ncbi:MAG TPA: MauE/DoxX family redox-associated membrane protein [Actinomycetota bacterium]|nr:MauE/DoxX family redox-associated membrane protein [Actinomycetota bacterium]
MESAEAYGFTTLRFLLALVFLVAGSGKVLDRKSFEKAVRNYKLVPESLAPAIASWLPRAELAAAFLLLAGIATPAVAFAVAAMLLGFAGAVAVNLLRGREIDCGCFSTPAPKKITWLTVARNVALAAAAVTLAVRTLVAGDDALAAGTTVATCLVSLQLVVAFRVASQAVGFHKAASFFYPRAARPREAVG